MTLLLVVSTVIILIGLGLFAYAGRIIAKRREKASWPQTTGEVLSSRIELGNKNRHNIVPDIRYKYKVNLVEYESTKISSALVDNQYVSAAQLEALREKYAVGKPVTVFYNPDDPAEAVLDTTAYIGDLVIFFVIGIMVLLCGFSMLMVYFV